MKILSILGTSHNGNTKAIRDLFLEEFKDGSNEFDEIVLPRDLNQFCLGCANCILKGEDKCPHYKLVKPLLDKMVAADLIIIASPIFVESCTSALKTFLDHFGYIWLVHRPNESMFKKVGLIITTAGGSGVKATNKLIKNNMFFWGIPKIYKYNITTLKMNGNYIDYKHKDVIKKQVNSQANKIKKSISKKHVGLKMRLYFKIFSLTQKKGWNKIDSDYWHQRDWIKGKKPYE